jgi:hypothetical protein
MGLGLEVGYLADLVANGVEGTEHFRESMATLNAYLESVGLPLHQEPDKCAVFSCDMFGYSGLHYLRRIAAYRDMRGVIPPPGGQHEDVANDPVVEEYYQLTGHPPKRPGLLAKLFGKVPRVGTFNHLMLHSDAEGYYLPQDFFFVLFPPKQLKIAGGSIGSSIRLRVECMRLAALLELPLDLDPESDELSQALELQGQGEAQWQRYGIESYVCLNLYLACEHSLRSGAAIVFC